MCNMTGDVIENGQKTFFISSALWYFMRMRKIIHVRVCFLPVCLKWWGMVDVLRSGVPALCPLYIVHHPDRPFHSWIQNSDRETTSNTLGCPRLVRTSLPARWTPRLNFCRLAAEPSLSDGGNYDKWFFLFSPFFHLKIWKVSSRRGDSERQL